MIRVLRLLEYQFDDYEEAEENMRHWAVPPFGGKQFGKRVVYSAILPPMVDVMKEADMTDHADTIRREQAPKLTHLTP